MLHDEATLSPTQHHVVETLKRHGDATADELAESLDITPSAVRQHLGSLRSAGYVTARPERGNTGRPADRYQATPLTERLFAGSDDRLALEILDDLNEENPELIARVFDRRRQRLVESSRRQLDETTLAERVAAITSELDAQGHLADSEQTDDGSYRINLRSCPMWTVAERYRQACTAELAYVEDLLPDAIVERVTHKTAGAHTCSYQITPRA